MSDLVIYALPVGGGILALSGAPGAGGDYRADVEHLGAWKPAMVISLTTHVELAEAQAGNLGPDLQDKGTRWVHLPVKGMGVPNANFHADWPEVSRTAVAALSGGGRVLVHCRGGCGRSGMVALRLMIEAGEAPDDALARLRGIRPCAIESDAQMAWAMDAERDSAVFVRHSED